MQSKHELKIRKNDLFAKYCLFVFLVLFLFFSQNHITIVIFILGDREKISSDEFVKTVSRFATM